MAEKQKKRENFSQEEKNTIIKFIQEHCAVIEDKSGNARMQIAKKNKWKSLEAHLRTLGFIRSWTELRAAYQRWKVAAKKNIAAYNKHVKGTGGGPSTLEPSDMDYIISKLCPEDFVIDENNQDSDGQRRSVINTQLDVVTLIENATIEFQDDNSTGTLVLLEGTNLEQPTPVPNPNNESVPGSSSLVRSLEIKSDAPASKKRKKEMTAYEEALLELQKTKHEKAMEFMEIEHEAKIQSILAEQKQKQEIHELQMKELLLRVQKYQRDDTL